MGPLSFSGVALLLALLLSFPWLPLTPPPTPASRADAFYAQLPASSRVPTTPPDWHYTIHVVATPEEAALLEQEFPNQVTDIVFVVQPADEAFVQRFRREVADYRRQQRLPAAKLDDRRPTADVPHR